MSGSFTILNYLAGMTGFVFDKDVLYRIALDCGVSEMAPKDLSEEQRDRCKMALLKTILETPYSTASHTSKHGEWQEQTGSQTLTAAYREDIKAQLQRLAEKYGEEELLQELEDMGATLQWLP